MSTRGENEEWGERKRERRECEEKTEEGRKREFGEVKETGEGRRR